MGCPALAKTKGFPFKSVDRGRGRGGESVGNNVDVDYGHQGREYAASRLNRQKLPTDGSDGVEVEF